MDNKAYLKGVDEDPAAIVMGEPRSFTTFHHHDKAQFSYLIGGVTFLYTPERRFLVPARHFVWIPPGYEHHFFHKYRMNTVVTCYIPVQELRAHPFFGKMGIYPINNLVLEMVMYLKALKGPLEQGGQKAQFVHSLVNVLPEFTDHNLPIALPTTDDQRLRQVLTYIQENLDQPLTMENTCHRFAFSERTLSRLFKARTDLSFFQYVKMARIIRAMEYLLETDKSISEIAYETGYNSISAFSNTFFELTGSRPTTFAQRQAT